LRAIYFDNKDHGIPEPTTATWDAIGMAGDPGPSWQRFRTTCLKGGWKWDHPFRDFPNRETIVNYILFRRLPEKEMICSFSFVSQFTQDSTRFNTLTALPSWGTLLSHNRISSAVAAVVRLSTARSPQHPRTSEEKE
jgi:hypothetical protein